MSVVLRSLCHSLLCLVIFGVGGAQALAMQPYPTKQRCLSTWSAQRYSGVGLQLQPVASQPICMSHSSTMARSQSFSIAPDCVNLGDDIHNTAEICMTPEEQAQVLHELAAVIERRGMLTPARIFIDAVAPLDI